MPLVYIEIKFGWYPLKMTWSCY